MSTLSPSRALFLQEMRLKAPEPEHRSIRKMGWKGCRLDRFQFADYRFPIAGGSLNPWRMGHGMAEGYGLINLASNLLHIGGFVRASCSQGAVRLPSSPVEFRCGSRWQPYDVVGVMGEHDDLRFVVVVPARSSTANTVSEVCGRRTFEAEAPWLNRSHRALVEIASVVRACLSGGEDVGA